MGIQEKIKKPNKISFALEKNTKLLKVFSPKYLLLLTLIVLVAVLTIAINYFGFKKTNTQNIQPPIKTRVLNDQSADWKIYSNTDLNFQISYPGNFYISTEEVGGKPMVKISNDSSFEKNEFALVITLEHLSDENFRPSLNPETRKVLNDFGFQEINIKFSNYLSGNFFRNPPWEYYQIVIPSMDPNKRGILTTTRIYKMNEIAFSENSEEELLTDVAKKILSSIKLVQ